jgi:hypothetical protein
MKISGNEDWDKEFEFVKWAKAKLKEFKLKGWELMVMQSFQISAFIGATKPKSVIGTCYPQLKIIWISQEFVYEFKLETTKDLFLHELAHAVTGEAHTKKFREFAKSIGCKGILANANPYIFDMYGRYDVTDEESTKCLIKYMEKSEMI